MLSIDQVSNYRRATDPEGISSKYALTSSFVQDGYRYWTDGAIAIRTISDEASTVDYKTPARIGEIGWSERTDEMVKLPNQPHKTFYESYRGERWKNDEYRPAQLSVAACLVGSVIISPRYFAIIRGLDNPYYKMSDDRKSLIVSCDDCQAVVMGIQRGATNQQYWFTVSLAADVDFPADVVRAATK